MNDDQRALEEQCNRAQQRREDAEPARIASLGAIAVEWVVNVEEYRASQEEAQTLSRRLNGLTDRTNRLNKQGGALEAAYRSLIGTPEQQLSSADMAKEMRGMAEWTQKTLAEKGGK